MAGSKVFIAILLAFPFGFRPGAPLPCEKPEAPRAEEPKPPSDAFEVSVRPVLRANCAPCHEPGGKMYGLLPFDSGQTISSHREGVLRRLEGDDRAAVEEWLASLPSSE